MPSVHDLTRRVVDRPIGGLNRCQIDHAAAASVWEWAAKSVCTREPQWFHGDVAADNLLNRGGRPAAVNDFGTGGIGDPACDTVIAWAQLGPASRAIFRRARGLDPDSWSRGRGWASTQSGTWSMILGISFRLATYSFARPRRESAASRGD